MLSIAQLRAAAQQVRASRGTSFEDHENFSIVHETSPSHSPVVQPHYGLLPATPIPSSDPPVELSRSAVSRTAAASESGKHATMYLLGLMHYYGDGMSVNKPKGIELVRQAAANGVKQAESFLNGLVEKAASAHLMASNTETSNSIVSVLPPHTGAAGQHEEATGQPSQEHEPQQRVAAGRASGADSAFEVMDSNGDGVLTREEWRMGVERGYVEGHVEQRHEEGGDVERGHIEGEDVEGGRGNARGSRPRGQSGTASSPEVPTGGVGPQAPWLRSPGRSHSPGSASGMSHAGARGSMPRWLLSPTLYGSSGGPEEAPCLEGQAQSREDHWIGTKEEAAAVALMNAVVAGGCPLHGAGARGWGTPRGHASFASHVGILPSPWPACCSCTLLP